MSNNLDTQYINLLKDIMENGTRKKTRNGETISVFGRTIRHNMNEGFPLLTTKKMFWKGIVTELIWFLRGDTNIKFLLDNNCHIWDGDAYNAYIKQWNKNFEETEKYDHQKPLDKEAFIQYLTDSPIEMIKRIGGGDLGPVYGKQWRRWDGNTEHLIHKGIIIGENTPFIDQIQNLINDLKNNPDSRRMMVNAWNVGEIDQMALPPCHYGFQVFTRELSLEERKKLCKVDPETECKNNSEIELYLGLQNIPTRAISLMYNARSQDVPLGTPFNIASYGLLLEILAKIVNMVPDELIANMGDCHIYTNQIDSIKVQLNNAPYTLPSIYINTEFWLTATGECGIGEFTDNVDSLIKSIEIDDFQIEKYQFHPPIKIPLST